MHNIDIFSTWKKIIALLKQKMNNPSIDTWIQLMMPIDIVNNIFYIQVPENFSKEWLTGKYLSTIRIILNDLLNQDLDVKFILKEEIPMIFSPTKEIESEKQNLNKLNGSFIQLNPKYSFESFVVGESNRFAYAASLAVAESPARTYNPFFMYGGVGLGKTHLMHAIAQHILNKNKSCKIAYVTSEKFTNDLINSIRDKKQEEFRSNYRSMDILLVDDIQFVAGKESTQEEFFHTFNTLYEANKQIIISSDRPPKEIPTLEDRLRTRFECGLTTDIQPPDLETRIAILRKKVQVENMNISDEVLYYIANRIQSNIRELEGALTSLVAFSSFYGHKNNISLSTATEVLKNLLPPKEITKINISFIHQVVADYFKIDKDDLTSKKRTKDIAFTRQIAMYLARQLTDLSLIQIGKYFGGRDHTTVIHAYERIKNELEVNPLLEETINKIINLIKT